MPGRKLKAEEDGGSSPTETYDEEVEGSPTYKKQRKDNDDTVDRADFKRLKHELHAAMTTNVELHNSQNRASAVLRRITFENQDLLEALLLLDSTAVANVEPAPLMKLSTEEKEHFDFAHSIL